jgi:hypothetical protein
MEVLQKSEQKTVDGYPRLVTWFKNLTKVCKPLQG